MRAARLRRSGEIAIVRAEGRSLRRGAFTARARTSAGPTTRIAVTASRTIGSAVARNRARRRVREAFRLAIRSGQPTGALDLVVAVRPEATKAEFRAILADATAVLKGASH